MEFSIAPMTRKAEVFYIFVLSYTDFSLIYYYEKFNTQNLYSTIVAPGPLDIYKYNAALPSASV